mmetsp:Transcript_65148/g.152498  ORF Transcript_65148/g.152498 Transcript_65148/m.152498 type:complete len:204 (-) Transcript_65148:17-628(-)
MAIEMGALVELATCQSSPLCSQPAFQCRRTCSSDPAPQNSPEPFSTRSPEDAWGSTRDPCRASLGHRLERCISRLVPHPEAHPEEPAPWQPCDQSKKPAAGVADVSKTWPTRTHDAARPSSSEAPASAMLRGPPTLPRRQPWLSGKLHRTGTGRLRVTGPTVRKELGLKCQPACSAFRERGMRCPDGSLRSHACAVDQPTHVP